MIIDYSHIEKIKFLHYEIDDQINLNFLKTFESIYHQNLNKKLDFIVTGGLGSLITYKRIYRSLADIDLLIDPKDIKSWIYLCLELDYDFCFEDSYSDKPEKRLRDFLDRKLRSLVFHDKKFDSKFEFININFTNSKKYYLFDKNEFNFKVKVPGLSYQNKVKFQREKDIDDCNFYTEYLQPLEKDLFKTLTIY